MLTHADVLATQVMEAAQKRLGPDYKFGDLSRAAADKLIQGSCCTPNLLLLYLIYCWCA